jgi:hypothetical protein
VCEPARAYSRVPAVRSLVQVYETIRTVSPNTMISSYRGDVCASKAGATLYTNDGPPPNTTDTSGCQDNHEGGEYFHPTEMHGITIQVSCNALLIVR